MLKEYTKRVRVTLIDEMLGTNPADPEIHERFIGSNAPDAESRAEELVHLPPEDMVERESTVFYRNPENPEIPQVACYLVYGVFKQACGFLRNVSDTKSAKIKAYKKKIDGLIKVYPDKDDKNGRFVDIHLSGPMGKCQRPLRAQTMKGERVALANSETIPAGSWFEFDIVTLDKSLWPAIEEWLDYGQYNGFGRWRNSGKGAFIWEYVK